jgi:hypothetical protein
MRIVLGAILRALCDLYLPTLKGVPLKFSKVQEVPTNIVRQ